MPVDAGDVVKHRREVSPEGQLFPSLTVTPLQSVVNAFGYAVMVRCALMPQAGTLPHSTPRMALPVSGHAAGQEEDQAAPTLLSILFPGPPVSAGGRVGAGTGWPPGWSLPQVTARWFWGFWWFWWWVEVWNILVLRKSEKRSGATLWCGTDKKAGNTEGPVSVSASVSVYAFFVQHFSSFFNTTSKLFNSENS